MKPRSRTMNFILFMKYHGLKIIFTSWETYAIFCVIIINILIKHFMKAFIFISLFLLSFSNIEAQKAKKDNNRFISGDFFGWTSYSDYAGYTLHLFNDTNEDLTVIIEAPGESKTVILYGNYPYAQSVIIGNKNEYSPGEIITVDIITPGFNSPVLKIKTPTTL